MSFHFLDIEAILAQAWYWDNLALAYFSTYFQGNYVIMKASQTVYL